MKTLLDIAPVSQTVEIRGVAVNLTGIVAEDISYLLGRFTPLVELAAKGNFSVKAIQDSAPGAFEAFCACGCGTRGNEDAEKTVASLALGEKLDLFHAIIKATLPGGVGPFAQKLGDLGILDLPGLLAGSPLSPNTTSKSPDAPKSETASTPSPPASSV